MAESASGENLAPGLYEAILTDHLRARLPKDDKLVRLDKVDRADIARTLSRHVGSLVEKVLMAPRFDADAGRQVSLVNDLIRNLIAIAPELSVFSDQTVDNQVRQLVELLRALDGGLGSLISLERPDIPLSQNALLVAAKHEPAFGSAIKKELESADSVDLLCAFVVWSGIRIFMDQLRWLRERGVRVRLITTTYTGTTDVRALEELAKIGVHIKVSYDTGFTRLHAKAWLFTRDSGFSTAYIGSSNLTHTALHEGLEWNVRLTQATSPDLLDRFSSVFSTYWEDPRFEDYDKDTFVAAIARETDVSTTELLPFELQPYPFQREMLYRLEVERTLHHRWKNLIVAATGSGKTVVSAFDYKQVSQKWPGASLLFVAHRQEILKQSLVTFRNVLHDGNFGELMVAGERPRSGKHVFASIQSLHHTNLKDLAPDFYEVVIIDEFHHAEAPTYARLLDYLKPRLLVGMTATPERTDGLDIKRWFDGHIAVELRLWDALEQGLLCPFQYFGVSDGVDLSELTWARGGYDTKQLGQIYTGNDIRVRRILDAVQELVEAPSRMKALGFCVSVEHARFMAERFRMAGIPSVAVSGMSSDADRSGALRDLRNGTINVIFSVDLFNEGLDVPDIDTVMFLRPTESPIVFLQQLGRGLRRAEGKAGLTVLDFIGQQHRRFRFEERFKALLSVGRREVLEQVEGGFPYLPAGCSISLDRQSQKVILDNIKGSLAKLRSQLAEKLQELGDVALQEFLVRAKLDLADVYSGTNPGWTVIRRQAGFVGDPTADEALLSQAVSRMLHIDDPLRVSTYLEWLSEPGRTIAGIGEKDHRLLAMLHFDLWPSDDSRIGLQESLARLFRSPNIVSELRELLPIAGANASHLVKDADLPEEVPLKLHARYARNEILAAFGEATPEKPPQWREGVRWVPNYKTDLFLITLNKSAARFSPTTRYRDYPISPGLFHWESQSTTSAASPTGQRYINHAARGSSVLLFVRENSVGESLGASPFLFLGKARHLSHEGDRPMAITWRLENDMPPDFFQAAKAAV
jgi:superfamily II DNA or RNA helicase